MPSRRCWRLSNMSWIDVRLKLVHDSNSASRFWSVLTWGTWTDWIFCGSLFCKNASILSRTLWTCCEKSFHRCSGMSHARDEDFPILWVKKYCFSLERLHGWAFLIRFTDCRTVVDILRRFTLSLPELPGFSWWISLPVYVESCRTWFRFTLAKVLVSSRRTLVTKLWTKDSGSNDRVRFLVGCCRSRLSDRLPGWVVIIG